MARNYLLARRSGYGFSLALFMCCPLFCVYFCKGYFDSIIYSPKKQYHFEYKNKYFLQQLPVITLL